MPTRMLRPAQIRQPHVKYQDSRSPVCSRGKALLRIITARTGAGRSAICAQRQAMRRQEMPAQPKQAHEESKTQLHLQSITAPIRAAGAPTAVRARNG